MANSSTGQPQAKATKATKAKGKAGNPTTPAVAAHDAALPLFPGEKREDYEALHARVVAAVAPRDALEELWVEDVTILTWEMKRLRRIIVGIVNAKMPEALKSVLSSGIYYTRAGDLARDWFIGDADAQMQVAELLTKMGLTMDDVAAQAMRHEIRSIDKVHAMLAQAEARRKRALRTLSELLPEPVLP